MSWVPARRVNASGLLVAGLGFLLTRVTVLESLSMNETTLSFLVGEALFLALGLGLTAFGLGLAVSTYAAADVTVVAMWSLAGTSSMFLLVALTHVEAMLGEPGVAMTPSQSLTARVLIAGAVGGVLTGLRAAANRRQQRQLSYHADRLTVLNRILRHEVLNKVSVIAGYADLAAETRESRAGHLDDIEESATYIDNAIDEVGFLTRAQTGGEDPTTAVALEPILEAELEAARSAHPAATFALASVPDERLLVRATDRLATALGHLFDNAVRHNDAETPEVTVAVETDGRVASVSIADNGPGMPDEQQAVLRNRTLPRYDDPTVGFGLAVTRLLIEQFGGSADVDTPSGGGTVVTLELLRVREEDEGRTRTAYGVEPRQLLSVSAAATVAGVAMGLFLQAVTGSLAIIGALYGVQDPVVGWITHQFHSVVFGVGFAALLAIRGVQRRTRRTRSRLAAGAAYGGFLWLFAAGVVMPLWLRGVGIPAPVPNLSLPGLAGHVLWGVTLAWVYTLLESLSRRQA